MYICPVPLLAGLAVPVYVFTANLSRCLSVFSVFGTKSVDFYPSNLSELAEKSMLLGEVVFLSNGDEC